MSKVQPLERKLPNE